MSDDQWRDYFPFETGEALAVEAKVLVFSLKGSGQVTLCEGKDLSLDVEIPAQSVLGKDIPEISLSVHLTHHEDGGENFAIITYKGREKIDNDVTMTSDLKKRERRVEPSIAIAGKTIGFTFCRSGDRRAEVRNITGLNLPFEIKIKIKPA
ncbi:MAG: hypothetical protein Kilf2KO_28040 [Rhodospirillales bacterium]